MSPFRQQVIDRFWEKEMRAPPGWDKAGTTIRFTEQHLYSGVQLALRKGRLVVAAPSQYVELVQSRFEGHPVEELFTAEAVMRLLAPEAREVIGPAHLSYVDETSYRAAPHDSCRELTADDFGQCEALAASLSAAELEQSGYDWGRTPAFGAFEGGVLGAAANYEIWNSELAHIIVATHALHRHRGLGSAAVSELVEHALARHLIPQYRALASNEHSLRLARALGFEHYVSTIYVRMA